MIFYWNRFWQEKSPYEVKAAQKKSDYEKLMTAYNKKQVNFWIICLGESKAYLLLLSVS